jgi:hypothetical protein
MKDNHRPTNVIAPIRPDPTGPASHGASRPTEGGREFAPAWGAGGRDAGLTPRKYVRAGRHP